MAQPSQLGTDRTLIDLKPFELFSLFLQFNRRLIALLHYFDSPLSTAESHFLAELNHNQTLISKDLSDKLFSDKSTVSRTLASLKKKGLIKNTQCKTDKRTKISTTTQKGLSLLQKDIIARNQEVISCSYTLTSHERAELTEILNELSDVLHAAQPPAIPDMEPLLVAIRRLGKVMGIIGGSVFETGFVTQYVQVLWLAYQSGGQISLKDLVFSLSYPPSEVSQLLSKLQSDSLILRQTLDQDKRFVSVSLTPKGFGVTQQIVKSAHNYFEILQEGLSENKKNTLTSLLVKCLVCPHPIELVKGKDSWSVKRIDTSDNFLAARIFLFEQYVYQGLHRYAGSVMIDPKHTCLVLHDNNKTIGLVEFIKEENNISFLNFCHPQHIPSRVSFCDITWPYIKDLPLDCSVALHPVVAMQLHLPIELTLHSFMEALTR